MDAIAKPIDYDVSGMNYCESHGVYSGRRCPKCHPIKRPQVIIGKDTEVGWDVKFAPGTVIGNNCNIGDKVITTGACWIGNNVNIRPGAIISKGVVIEDWVFIGPGVITNHTKHVDWGRNVKSKPTITYIAFGSIIGSGTVIVAGVDIKQHSIIGAGSVVTKDIPGDGVYFGNPCVSQSDLKPEMYLNKPHVHAMYRNAEVYKHLKSYMTNLASWNNGK